MFAKYVLAKIIFFGVITENHSLNRLNVFNVFLPLYFGKDI